MSSSRYRAGKVPAYAKESNSSNSTAAEEDQPPIIIAPKSSAAFSSRSSAAPSSKPKYVAEVIANLSDEEEEEEEDQRDNDDEMEQESTSSSVPTPTTTTTTAQSQSQSQAAEESSEEDEEEHDRRRARLREKALQKQQEDVEPKQIAEIITDDLQEDDQLQPMGGVSQLGAQQQEEEDEESEYESEEEEEEELASSRPHIAPVFKRKSDRDTVTDQKKLDSLQEALEKEKEKRAQDRKTETKELLQQEIKKNIEEAEQAKAEADKEEDIIEEEQPVNEAEDISKGNLLRYEKWKIRELARIKRDQKEREDAEREREETERRRNMTDAEIMKEDKDSKLAPKDKKKMKFLQKYYHKGAFFRTFDEKDEIQNKWDFTQPTLEDRGDRSILPSVMQVKNFGKSGRTKYTHLVDQDTTTKDMLWFQNDKLKQKYKEKLGGVGTINDDRSKKRKV